MLASLELTCDDAKGFSSDDRETARTSVVSEMWWSGEQENTESTVHTQIQELLIKAYERVFRRCYPSPVKDLRHVVHGFRVFDRRLLFGNR
ncbi:unnamed protein product [Ectocarpus sp. 13 AM-2016]